MKFLGRKQIPLRPALTILIDDPKGYYGLGVMWTDFDNDGWLDLMVVNGHVYPQIEGAFPGRMYGMTAGRKRDIG